MILEILSLLAIGYICLGLGYYVTAVAKTRELTGVWTFKITRKSIGVCEYPYWTLFWLEKVANAKRGNSNGREQN